MNALCRTIVGTDRQDLDAKVEKAKSEGWAPIGTPTRLYVGGKPVEGRGSWTQAMMKRGDDDVR